MKIKIEKGNDGDYYLFRHKGKTIFGKDKWVSAHWSGFNDLQKAQEKAAILTTPYCEIVETQA